MSNNVMEGQTCTSKWMDEQKCENYISLSIQYAGGIVNPMFGEKYKILSVNVLIQLAKVKHTFYYYQDSTVAQRNDLLQQYSWSSTMSHKTIFFVAQNYLSTIFQAQFFIYCTVFIHSTTSQNLYLSTQGHKICIFQHNDIKSVSFNTMTQNLYLWAQWHKICIFQHNDKKSVSFSKLTQNLYLSASWHKICIFLHTNRKSVSFYVMTENLYLWAQWKNLYHSAQRQKICIFLHIATKSVSLSTMTQNLSFCLMTQNLYLSA